jgi:uncharacterized protein YciI
MRYYVALITSVVDQASIAAAMDEHHHYMAAVEENGQILAAGPFEAPPDSPASMIILATATPGEARALMDAEPLTAKGLRTYELRAWDVREGTVVSRRPVAY